MVLYTDGITDARSPAKEFFGEQKFEELLRTNRGKPVIEMGERIISEITKFQAGDMSDDITLLLLCRNI